MRLEWQEVPSTVRARIESHLGGPVRDVEVQRGGFSPAFAGIVRTAGGAEAFVKAGGPRPNPEVPELYRREWTVASALPRGIPSPEPLWFEDDGAWVTLAFEAIRGHAPKLPWKAAELDRVLGAHEQLMRHLTPAPIPAPTLGARLATAFRGFRTLRAARLHDSGSSPDVPSWVIRHLDELAEVEAEWVGLTVGSTLLHCDVRADNIVLRGREVYFVDWPHACIGPAFVDLLAFLPSVAMQGGPKPWTVFDRSPLTRDATSEAVTATVAAVTGYFLEAATRRPPPGLPTLREFQRGQGMAALEWLQRLRPDLT